MGDTARETRPTRMAWLARFWAAEQATCDSPGRYDAAAAAVIAQASAAALREHRLQLAESFVRAAARARQPAIQRDMLRVTAVVFKGSGSAADAADAHVGGWLRRRTARRGWPPPFAATPPCCGTPGPMRGCWLPRLRTCMQRCRVPAQRCCRVPPPPRAPRS